MDEVGVHAGIHAERVLVVGRRGVEGARLRAQGGDQLAAANAGLGGSAEKVRRIRLLREGERRRHRQDTRKDQAYRKQIPPLSLVNQMFDFTRSCSFSANECQARKTGMGARPGSSIHQYETST